MNKYVCIDAGHGGKDCGAINPTNKRMEKNDTLNISLKIKSILESQGVRVLLTRNSDTYPSLIDRTNLANKEKVSLYVSMHRNSFSSNVPNGAEVWTYTKTSSITEAFANNVLKEIVSVGVQLNRGVKKGDYHVLRETDMDAILIELGFISNDKDNILYDKNIDKYALAVAKGILKSLGQEYKSPKS